MSFAKSSSLAITAESPITSGQSQPAELSLSRVVASLQVLLAARRAARSDEHAYWYTIARGM
jgi:hypothetical protein